MARDLNRLAAAARQQKEQERIERHEKLETNVTGLLTDILDSTFPETVSGDPDWDKFNWTKAEQLQQLLTDFQAGRSTRRTSDEDRAQQTQSRRTQPEPPPAATVPILVTPDPDDEPEPDLVDQTTPARKTWRQRLDDLRQNS